VGLLRYTEGPKIFWVDEDFLDNFDWISEDLFVLKAK
jgi:hypothetical protein